MNEGGKQADLRRISADLEQFVASYCAPAGGEPSSFADEKCHDAALMLREALDNLKAAG